MRNLLDGSFSNIIKSQQALKLDKDYSTKLSISINAADETLIDVKELQRKLKEISHYSFDKLSIEWLESTKIFEPSYLEKLSSFKFPKYKLSSKEDGKAVNIDLEGNYSELILLESGLQSLLSEARFNSFYLSSKEDEGYFYAFGTDRLNIKIASFFDSNNISVVEDGSRYRVNSDYYSLIAIILQTGSFNYIGTTNPLIAFTFTQPVVNFCDEERWLEGWPGSNFAPSEALFDKEKHKGFYLKEANFVNLNEARTRNPEAIIIADEITPFEMAHATSHYGNIVWLWSRNLTQDVNITPYSAKVLWS